MARPVARNTFPNQDAKNMRFRAISEGQMSKNADRRKERQDKTRKDKTRQDKKRKEKKRKEKKRKENSQSESQPVNQ